MSDRSVNALAQCLPVLFTKITNKQGLRQDSGGYLRMADVILRNLNRHGYRVVSHSTYDRMAKVEAAYYAQARNLPGTVHRDGGMAPRDRGIQREDILLPVLEG